MEKKGEQNFFTSQMIKDCMRKVTTINLHQTIKVSLDTIHTTIIHKATTSNRFNYYLLTLLLIIVIYKGVDREGSIKYVASENIIGCN